MLVVMVGATRKLVVMLVTNMVELEVCWALVEDESVGWSAQLLEQRFFHILFKGYIGL